MIGVYRITNTITDRVYIGSAVDVEKRVRRHKQTLRAGKHPNPHLQQSWVKHGEAVFLFEPLVECSIETRKDREQRFIDAYIEHGLPVYNMRPVTISSVGFKYVCSEDTRKKLSCAKIGKTKSLETRRRMSVAQTGKKHSEATKAKLRGRVRSREAREKMSLAHTGMTMPESTRVAIQVANTGRVHSLESRGKQSTSMRAVWERRRLRAA